MKKTVFLRGLYLALFLLVLALEIFIGVFVRDRFVRPYLGDVLVIVLLCLFVRIFFLSKPRLLWLYMTLFGIFVEFLQLIRIDRILGVEGTLLGIIIGSSFSIPDILCYIAGGAVFILIEFLLRKVFL